MDWMPQPPGMMTRALQQTATVVRQQQLARDTWVVRLDCPEIARQIVPGQFFMVRAPGRNDPLLGRPFALYDIYTRDGEPWGVDFGYLVVGKLTSLMTGWQLGDSVEIWGPLGNGFPLPDARHLMFVAGGIGQTPFLAAAREALALQRYGEPPRVPQHVPEHVSMCYGVRSSDYLAGLDDFALEGLHLKTSTDDGTAGHHGLVTELLTQAIDGPAPPDCVYCCGPEPMMEAVATICAKADIRCWLSLETPMACGFGACFSCVTRVRLDQEGWDYHRICVEGPVFRADRLMLGDDS